MLNILVSGASRGIGLSIASTLAASGYRVIGIARSPSDGFAVAAAAAAAAGQGALEFQPFDLSRTEAIGELVRGVRQRFGPLYGLVNNAGLGSGGLLSTMRESEVEMLLRINSLAPILLSRYAVRSMMVERSGRIVNIASIVAVTGFKGLSVYSATKASMLGFTHALAREVGELGITVNAVAPGFVDTEMTHGLAGEDRERVIRRSALRRLVEPADVAAAVDFLISERARNITGTTLTVDAGTTA